MDADLSFGEWLKRRRLGLGMTQDELGRQIGYSGVSVRKVEADERRPSYEMAEKLAQALAVAPEDRPAFMRFARDEASTLPVATTAGGIPAPARHPTHPPVPNNLPVQISSFVGREREMTRLAALLDTSRLVTLTGVGGTGKTRLAQEVAARRLDHYPNGVWLVELAPLMDPTLIIQSVATALNLRDEGGRPLLATLIDYLRAKHLLLILDNCEHLIEAASQLADSLLHACPRLHIMATSREAFGIIGETIFQVPSLTLPGRDAALAEVPATLERYEAMRLFIDRTSAVQPGFVVTSASLPAVAQICTTLDGIPLAIELAAARVRTLPVTEIAARLDDRFRLLTGGNRTALPRQQTLQALIDWSHGLLTEGERILLRRLSVFAGGWTLDAAEAVCADQKAEGRRQKAEEEFSSLPTAFRLLPSDVLDLLTRLVEKSLVVVDASGEETRYRFLETIRQYGRDKLLEAGEGDRVRDQHVAYFLKLAEESETELHGPQQIAWMQRMATEADNFRAALRWSVASEQGLRLVGALAYFWWLDTYQGDRYSWVKEVLTQTTALGRTALRAKALQVAGMLCHDGSKRAWYEESLAIAREVDDRLLEARALVRFAVREFNQNNLTAAAKLVAESQALFEAAGIKGLTPDTELLWLGRGDMAVALGDYTTARTIYEEGIVSLQKMGDHVWAAAFSSHLAWLDEQQGDYAAASQRYTYRLDTARAMKSTFNILEALLNLIPLMNRQEDYATAAAHVREGLALAQELGNKGYIFQFTAHGGVAAWLEGDERQAAALYSQSLRMVEETQPHSVMAYLLRAMAGMLLAHGEAALAVQWCGVATTIQASYINLLGTFPLNYERDLAAARSQLGDVAYEAAWAAGQAMTLEQVISDALAYMTARYPP